jgi:hypothetical protein
MKNIVKTIAVAIILAFSASAEVYECTHEDGCIAKRGPAGDMQEVRFAEGDLISSEGNWVTPPGEGWVLYEDKTEDRVIINDLLSLPVSMWSLNGDTSVIVYF